MSTSKLVSLHVYPLKSAGGIALDHVRVDEVGLEHDRRWMVVDEHGRFLTQRSHPRVALLRTALADRCLRVSGPGTSALELPLAGAEVGLGERASEGPIELVPVWEKERDAVSCGLDAAAWMSSFLGVGCRVVRSVSPIGVPRLGPRETVRAGFADAFPALLVSQASLDDLNGRLFEALPMNRFRPNLVVDGVAPFAEDRWRRVRVGEATVVWRKLCLRCATTTTDQETGERGVEPLRTLASYRRVPDGEVAFGVNVGFEGAGVLRVGDPVRVEETSA